MVKQSLIDTFIHVIYENPPKKYYLTNKTIVKHLDVTRSMNLLDMVDYGVKNNKGYQYILVVIDNFSKFGWVVPLKNKFARTITDEVSNLIIKSKRKANLKETDDGKKFVNETFSDFLKLNGNKRYSRYTEIGAVMLKGLEEQIETH